MTQFETRSPRAEEEEARKPGHGEPSEMAERAATEGAVQPQASIAARYGELVGRIREVLVGAVPAGATVAVVSRGDANLLALNGRRGWHFPQTEDGTYTGHHPADSDDAIAQLEALHVKGADYLLFPATARWWLEHYDDFRRHLEGRYRVLVDEEETCVLFSLREPPVDAADQRALLRYRELVVQVREVVDSTLPPDASLVVLNEGDPALLQLDGRQATAFPAAEDADDAHAAAELETLWAKGADFLVVPASARWWLDLRPSLKRQLERRYRLVVRQEHVCRVYELAMRER